MKKHCYFMLVCIINSAHLISMNRGNNNQVLIEKGLSADLLDKKAVAMLNLIKNNPELESVELGLTERIEYPETIETIKTQAAKKSQLLKTKSEPRLLTKKAEDK